jgi:branched-subunit amino acid aminotransferase/4-amino-4-deoxychorismate lyase
MTSPLCFINDHFESYPGAKVHVSDLALHRGYGVFDYCREIGGRVPFLEDYLDRFYRSAAGLRLDVSLNREQLKEKIFHLLRENRFLNSGIKILLTGGDTDDFYQPVRPNLLIFNMPYHAPDISFDKGVKLVLFEYQRFLPEFKSINYLPGVWLLSVLKEKGAIEPLYHFNGKLLETARANIFLVKDNTLVTPGKGILHGITRKHLLIMARERYMIEEREVGVEEIFTADEIFMTGTSKHVLPVIQIDDKVISNGSPGPVTMKLMEEFSRYMIERFS